MTVSLIVAAVLVVVAVLVLLGARTGYGPGGGPALRRRFGAEYERELAAQEGDARATDRALRARLRRHRAPRPRPLAAATFARYEARWADVQGEFVDSPRQSAVEAERLLASAVAETGLAAADDRDAQLAALSVHRPAHVAALRRVHSVARGEGEAETEELRQALVAARALLTSLGPRTRKGAEPADDASSSEHRTGLPLRGDATS